MIHIDISVNDRVLFKENTDHVCRGQSGTIADITIVDIPKGIYALPYQKVVVLLDSGKSISTPMWNLQKI